MCLFVFSLFVFLYVALREKTCGETLIPKSSENHDFYVAKVFLSFMFFCVTMLEKTCVIDIDPKTCVKFVPKIVCKVRYFSIVC